MRKRSSQVKERAGDDKMSEDQAGKGTEAESWANLILCSFSPLRHKVAKNPKIFHLRAFAPSRLKK
jgi:hypothetical protein